MSYYLLIGEEVEEVSRDEWHRANGDRRASTILRTKVLDVEVKTEFCGLNTPTFETYCVNMDVKTLRCKDYETAESQHERVVEHVKQSLTADNKEVIPRLLAIIEDLTTRMNELEETVYNLSRDNY